MFYLLRQFKDIQMQVLNIGKMAAICGGSTMPVPKISGAEQKILDTIAENACGRASRNGTDEMAHLWASLYRSSFAVFYFN
jgi:hypothetical protein